MVAPSTLWSLDVRVDWEAHRHVELRVVYMPFIVMYYSVQVIMSPVESSMCMCTSCHHQFIQSD